MFADIVGSTQLYEKLGDAVAAEVVNQCIEKMTTITQSHSGIVINTIGDEIMSRFESADSAVKAACNIHEKFNAEPVSDYNITLSLRIGIHYGPMVNRQDDVFGDTVNVASRVSNVAIARQIITTEETITELSHDLLQKTRQFDRIGVKGKKKDMLLYEVLWEERDITVIGATISPTMSNHCLHLIYQDQSQTIQNNSSAFFMGRNPDSNLMVEAELVSRVHAYCVYRRGKFILIDQSTNGTFVKSNEGREIYIRREEVPLVGRGLIGLGESTAIDKGQLLQFICT